MLGFIVSKKEYEACLKGGTLPLHLPLQQVQLVCSEMSLPLTAQVIYGVVVHNGTPDKRALMLNVKRPAEEIVQETGLQEKAS